MTAREARKLLLPAYRWWMQHDGTVARVLGESAWECYSDRLHAMMELVADMRPHQEIDAGTAQELTGLLVDAGYLRLLAAMYGPEQARA